MESIRLRPSLFDLFPIILAIIIALIPVYKFAGNSGSVSIYHENTLVANFPIDKDTTIVVDGYNGPWIVSAQNGSVFVDETHCPKGICKSMGRISRPGMVIICAPGKNAIVIEGGGTKLDATTR